MPLTQTLLIIAVTCVISFLGFSNQRLKAGLIFWPPGVARGQYHRLVTHGFLHADGSHLLFNMFTLFFFGPVIERLYAAYLGGFGFIAFYLAAIVIAILPSYIANRHNANYASLGASGAVSAVLFAYIILAPWSMLYLFGVVPIPAILFGVGYTAYSLRAQRRGKDNINHSAHLWGAAFGVVITCLLQPARAADFLAKLLAPLG